MQSPVAVTTPRRRVEHDLSDADKAERLAAELKKQGFAAYTEHAGKVVRVRVGPIAGRSAADKAAVQLKTLGFSTVITAR